MRSFLFVCLGLIVSLPVLAASDSKIELSVYVNIEATPAFATATLIERTPGKLKALVDTLTEQKSNQLLVKNNDESAKIICQTSSVVTSCRFKFIQQFPNIIVAPEGYFVSKKLEDFIGLQIMTNNPNLEIPFEVIGEKGQSFNLYLGNGKFQTSAHISIANQF